MPTRNNINKFQYQDAIQERFWDTNYIYEDFRNNPVASAVGGGAASGTAGTPNILAFPFSHFEYVAIGTQTITAPKLNADGLNLGSMDQTASEGLEIGQGILARQNPAFVIGEAEAFFIRARFKVEDVSGVGSLMVGFRKAEAYQADFNDYADLAAFNLVGTDIKTETIIGGAATVTTDTTDNWADNEEHELIVNVSASGVVTYLLDGEAPTTTAAYTFTDGLTVVPVVRFVQAADIAGSVPMMVYEVGTQAN